MKHLNLKHSSLTFKLLYSRDLFRKSIIRNYGKFSVMLIILFSTYFLGLQFIDLLVFKWSIFPLLILNTLFYLTSSSLSIEKTKHFDSDLKQIQLSHMEIFSGRVFDGLNNSKQNGDLEDINILNNLKIKNAVKNSITHNNNANILFFHNLKNNHIITTMGFQLRAVANNIHANIEDIYRKIAESEDFIPLTYQIEFKRISHLESASGNEQTEFNYQIFFYRTEINGTKKKIINMCNRMARICANLQYIIELNFPHYKFELLSGNDLYSGIRSSIFPMKCSASQYLVSDPIQRYKKLKFKIPLLILLSLNSASLLIASLFINHVIPNFILIAILYGGWACCYIGKVLYHQNIFAKTDLHSFFLPINLFPEEIFYHTGLDSIFVHTVDSSHYYAVQQFSLDVLNRAYNHNNMKLYRGLISLSHDNCLSFTHQFFTERQILNDISQLKKKISENQLVFYNENPTYLPMMERKNCGFFKFQSLFTLSYSIHKDFINSPDLGEIVSSKRNRYIQLISLAFPSSSISLQSPKILYQSLIKAKTWGSFHSPLNIMNVTGKELAILTEIPLEIHKYLPLYYPGEFSTPFLDDEINFGAAFNPENYRIQDSGGISKEELTQNMLLSGDNYQNVHQKSLIMSHAILSQTDLSMIIFDWEGSTKHIFGLDELSPNRLKRKHIKHYIVGENFGLQLFSLLPKNSQSDNLSYFKQICDVFGTIMSISQDQTSMLLNSLLQKLSSDRAISYIKEIFDFLFEKSPLLKHRNELYAIFSLFQTGLMKIAFDSSNIQFIDPSVLSSVEDTIILDLSKLTNIKFKTLFIHTFLLQYYYLHANSVPQTGNRIIFLPYLNAVFNQDADYRNHIVLNDLLIRLKEIRCSFITETAQIGMIHNSISEHFQTFWALRTNISKNLREITAFLNFDSSFTNDYSHQTRKSSYQSQFLKTLDSNKTIVFREKINKPYVFQFDDFGYFVSILQKTIETRSIYDIQHAPERPKLQFIIDQSPLQTSVDIDFAEFPSLLSELHLFLIDCENKSKHMTVIPKHQLLQDLDDVLDIAIKKNYPLDVKERKDQILKILEMFFALRYFELKTLTMGNSMEARGFELTQKAKESIRDFNIKKKLIRDQSSETEFVKNPNVGSEMLVESQNNNIFERKEELDLSNETKNIQYEDGKVIDKELVWDDNKEGLSSRLELNLENCKDSLNEKRDIILDQQPALKKVISDIDYSWLNQTREFLYDTIVYTKIKLQKEGFNSSLEYLKERWQKAIEKIAQIPRARALWKKLKEKYDIITTIQQENQVALQKTIQRLENYIITI